MTSQRSSLSKRCRLVLSVLFLLHLFAILLPPLAFQTQGPFGQSPFVATLTRPLDAYSQFLYLNRGYAFFAPDPGPSHLIQAAITDGEGGQVEVMIPDRQVHWPRLLYHRHFMLTEYLYDIYQPPLPPPGVEGLDPEEEEYWLRSRARYENFRQSMVQHLKSVNPGRDVAIRRIEHLIPDMLAFTEQAVSLTDPESYRILLDQSLALPEDEAARRAEPASGESRTSAEGDRVEVRAGDAL